MRPLGSSQFLELDSPGAVERNVVELNFTNHYESISLPFCWLATVLLWRSACARELQKAGRLNDSEARPRAVSRADVGMPLS